MKKHLAKIIFRVVATALSITCVPAYAGFFDPDYTGIRPVKPMANEKVFFQQYVECRSLPDIAKVSMNANTIRVERQKIRFADKADTAELSPCPRASGQIELGRFPGRKYRLEVVDQIVEVDKVKKTVVFTGEELPVFSGDFEVVAADNRARSYDELVSRYVPPAVPMDYSGLWWDPRYVGEAVFVQQLSSRDNRLLISFNTYDENGKPAWYLISDVKQLDTTAFKGTLYRVQGTPLLGSNPQKRPLELTSVTQSLYVNFGVSADGEEYAEFSFQLGEGDASKGYYRYLRRYVQPSPAASN